MGKIAFVFAGQGAQKIGMGKELAEYFAVAADTFKEASQALGIDMEKMIFCGDEKELMLTENTQPAIVTMSIAALRVIEQHGIKADMAAGLSLGEYSAHVAAGTFAFSESVRLVKKRGKFMQEEVPEGVGAMAAVLGLSAQDIEKVCTEASKVGICEPANFNCPGQIVVSGERAAVEAACDIAGKMGAKRAVKLAVSAPFHCSMLKGAGEKLMRELENIEYHEMNIPVISNVTADYVEKKEDVKELLKRQVSSSVRWEESVRRMIDGGCDTFIEIGPGKALSGFVKKIDKEVKIFNVEDVASLEKTLNGVK